MQDKIYLSILDPPYPKPYGMLVSEQFLFWLYLKNWVGAALLKFLHLKTALIG